MTADEVAALLSLEPMPLEGGRWAQTWRDDHGSGIYFLVQPGDFSAMHRLDGPELWHHYLGAAARMLLLHPDGGVEHRMLGGDLGAGQRPFAAVPAGVWMGAESTGDWSLVGTTMAPPFSQDGFELGDRDELVATYPEATDDIVALTRPHEERP